MIIRPASLDDAAAISHVHIAAWRSTYRGIVPVEYLHNLSEPDRTEKWLGILAGPEQRTFVAEDETQGVVGFANGGPNRDGSTGHTSELYAIYLLAEWRGQGIGRRLVAEFARWLKDSAGDSMLVCVLERNPYRRFYETLGGRWVAENSIEIGGRTLVEVAYGWDLLEPLIENRQAS